MSEKRRVIWMEITRDKYRLPVAVADSANELARMTGRNAKSIMKQVRSAEKGETQKSRWIRVFVDDEEDENGD